MKPMFTMTDDQRDAIQQAIDLLQAVLTPQTEPPPIEPPPIDEPPPVEPPPPVTSIAVTDAASLTAALTQGGTIQIAPGTYSGNFVVAVPETTLIGLSPMGRRVTPADVSAWTLTPADPLQPTLSVHASRVRVQGLFLTSGAPDRDCVLVGSPTATDAAAQPDDVTFESVVILAGEQGGHRGLSAHGSHITLIRSHIANFWEIGRDSQAFYANNGSGPYLLEDNYLEATGENVLFGGDTVRIPDLVPSDITIRGNDIVKPLEWKVTKRGSVKNLVEFKNARRVLVENNRLDGCWKDAQDGTAIVLTPRNQYGDSPWVTVDDVTIRGNVVRNTPDAAVLDILGTDYNHVSQRVRRVVIEGNLFLDARSGILVTGGVSEALIIRRNTFPAIQYRILAFDGKGADGLPQVVTPLTLEGNVFLSGEYGITAPTTGVGVPTLTVWAVPYAVTGNVIERSAKRSIAWPAGNTLLAPGGLAPLLDAASRLTSGEAGW